MRKLSIIALVLIYAAEARGDAVQTLRLIRPPPPDPVVEHVQRVFTRQVQSRCDARVVAQGEAALTVEPACVPSPSARSNRRISHLLAVFPESV